MTVAMHKLERQQILSNDGFYWDLAELNPDAAVFDEYQEAYLGYGYKNGMTPVAVYSYDFIINILATNYLEDPKWCETRLEGIDEEDEAAQVATALDDAIEYFNYNIGGVGKGDNNEHGPIFLKVPQWDERDMDEG